VKIYLFLFKINSFIFFNHFDILILKKLKNYYFNIFMKNTLKKQPSPTPPQFKIFFFLFNNRGILNFTNQFSLGRLGKISQEQARVDDQQYCMSSVSPNLAWKSDREKRRSFYVRYFSGEHVAELLGMGLRQRDEQMMDWMDGWCHLRTLH
jgi:hypothetical protein